MSIILDGSAGITSVTGSPSLCVAGPAFSAYMGSSQTLSAATNTNIACNTKNFDTAGCYNNTSSTVTLNGISTPAYAFAPNVAGYYQVNLLPNGAMTSGVGYPILYKNGAVNLYGMYSSANSNGLCIFTSALVYMNGTSDYVQMYFLSSAGGSMNTGSSSTTFSASMVRSA